MKLQTSSRLAVALPHVNLLPPEIGERQRLRQVQMGVFVALAVTIGAVGFLYMNGTKSVDTASKQVATATTESQTLTNQLATFNDVRGVAAALAAHEGVLTQAMSTEVSFSTYLANFATLPTTTWLQAMTLTETVAPGSLSSPSQAPASIGTASFQGVGLKYASLADWLDRVAKIGDGSGLTNVYLSTAAESFIGPTKVVNFQATSGLTSTALSARCAKAGVC